MRRLVLIFHVLLCFGCCVSDPCSEYMKLPRADYRGGNCIYDQDKQTCDAALTPGWYRAISVKGNDLRLRNSTYFLGECGTKFPIWMDGSHPTVAEGEVERTLLQAFTSQTMSVTVKNCIDEYFVYKLSRTGSCPEAYCFGMTDSDPCPPFDPCDLYEYELVDYNAARSSDCFASPETCFAGETFEKPFVAFRDANNGYLNASQTPSGIGACGSTSPIWIKESLSTDESGIGTFKACVESAKDSCETELRIRSKTCDGFTVYEIHTTVACSRLCLDDPYPTCPIYSTSTSSTKQMGDDTTTMIGTQQIDPCSEYMRLPRADYRGGNCLYDADKQTCDAAIKPGWYRATTVNGDNLRMRDAEFELGQCGTKFPIWMTGPHPSVAEGEVERTLLQVFTDDTKSVMVKNCNDEYFVYKLSPTGSCPEAYCFGVTDSDSCPPFDPCDIYEHEFVDYNPERSSECSVNKDNFCVTETFGQSWVTFRNENNGFLNASRKPSGIGACGSSSPIWIKDSLSTDDAGTTYLKACVESDNDSCKTELIIRSKTCEKFTVYDIPNTIPCSRLCLDDPDPTCPVYTTTKATTSTVDLTTDNQAKERPVYHISNGKEYIWIVAGVIGLLITIAGVVVSVFIYQSRSNQKKRPCKVDVDHAYETIDIPSIKDQIFDEKNAYARVQHEKNVYETMDNLFIKY